MPEENKENLITERARELGLGGQLVSGEKLSFLGDLLREDFALLQSGMETMPPYLRGEIVHNGLGDYFVTALKENLIAPHQGEALAVALSQIASKLSAHPKEFDAQIKDALPLLAEIKTHNNPADVFQGFVRGALLKGGIDNFISQLPDVTDTRKQEIETKILQEVSNIPVEEFVENGKLKEHYREVPQDIKNEVMQTIRFTKVLNEVWGTKAETYAALPTEPEAREKAEELLGMRLDLAWSVFVAFDAKDMLRDEAGEVNPDLKEVLTKLQNLKPEIVEEIISVFDVARDKGEDPDKAAFAKLKEKAGIDIAALVEKKQQESAPQARQEGGHETSGSGGGDATARVPEKRNGESAAAKEENEPKWKKFVNTKTVAGAAIVATLAIIAALVGKGGKNQEQAAGRGR